MPARGPGRPRPRGRPLAPAGRRASEEQGGCQEAGFRAGAWLPEPQLPPSWKEGQLLRGRGGGAGGSSRGSGPARPSAAHRAHRALAWPGASRGFVLCGCGQVLPPLGLCSPGRLGTLRPGGALRGGLHPLPRLGWAAAVLGGWGGQNPEGWRSRLGCAASGGVAGGLCPGLPPPCHAGQAGKGQDTCWSAHGVGHRVLSPARDFRGLRALEPR